MDVSLPDGSGFEFCEKVRRTSQVPILFLTASDTETSMIMGLDIGGDDYITKPFKLAVLLSRINAILRRSRHFQQTPGELCSNGITLQPLEGRACKNGVPVELTAAEYKLLRFFMERPGRILSGEQIMSGLWDCDGSFVDSNTLAVYIRRLRAKIEDDPAKPARIVTVRRMGYKWNAGGGMKPRMERNVFFLEILLCATVIPILAAMFLRRFPRSARSLLLASSLCVAAAVLALCWRYLQTRDQTLEDAAFQVAEYILDRRKGGIACSEEGAMYHLFHEVNSLVTIADARADSQRRAKEFLRDTISDISHQLKTPIAALNIYNGILQKEAADAATVQKFTALSEQELDRMESLVQSLLKMA